MKERRTRLKYGQLKKCWTFRLDDSAPLVYEIAALDTALIVNESFNRSNKEE